MRLNSLDSIKINNWQWEPFLNEAIATLECFNLEPCNIPTYFLQKEATFGSKVNPKTARIQTWGAKSKQIRIARAACIEAGDAASVLNFVITPLNIFDLPFFGADLVTLPSGYLLALDLQPALKHDSIHTQDVWSRLMPIHQHWQSLLPLGGPIPEEAQSFFSPGFLWTRLPLGKEGEEMISEVIWPAFRDYLSLYINLIQNAKEVSATRAQNILLGQQSYMNYRAKKDPARAMLKRFYGHDWTESYIHKVLFDLSD